LCEISSGKAKGYETKYEKILNLAEKECPPAEIKILNLAKT
jgi:hypothetical protein